MNIGDIFMALKIDPSGELKAQVTKSAQDAGNAGGLTLGKAMSAALKGTSLAIGAALGVATKGALEAEAAQGKFMAATGASREEAKKFVSGMDSLAGSAGAIGHSFEEIAATGTMVEQQFGTTGQATTDLTGKILEFAKVTGQDATQAAGDLEDMLSSFGLGAADAPGVMDKLVASSQKFGTDAGPAATQALKDMAPALDAMGMGLNDGIEFLNAFEVAGGDASTAASALNKAIKTLKPGQDIDDLITQVGKIQDPIDRAKEATKLFGKAAGPGMALLIKPGMTSLDDFGISAQEAGGKVHKAADDMLTFGDRIKGWTDKALAGARELGQQFGPALSGIGAVIGALGPTIAKGLGSAWDSVIHSSIVKEAVEKAGAAAGAAYTAAKEFADHILEGVKTAWDEAIMHGPIHDAIVKAGAAAGGLYSTAKEFASKILEGISRVWLLAGAPGSQVLASAVAAGEAAGASWGIGVVTTIGTLGLAAIAKIATDALAGDAKPGGANFADNYLKGLQEKAAQNAPAVGAEVGTTVGSSAATATVQSYEQGIANGTLLGPALPPAWFDAAEAQAKRDGTDVGHTAAQATGAGLVDGAKDFHPESWAGYYIDKATFSSQAYLAGQAAMHSLARGLDDSMPSIRDEWKAYVKATKEALDPTKQLLWLEGRLSGKKLAEGLESSDPIAKARAEDMRDHIQAQIDDLKSLGYTDGKDTGKGVADGIDDSTPAAVRQASQLASAVNRAMQALITKYKLSVIGGNFGGEHGFSGGGRAQGGPVNAGTLYRVNERRGRTEYFRPNVGGTVLPLAPDLGDVPSAGGITVPTTINIYDATDPEKVGNVVVSKLQHVLTGALSMPLDTSRRPVGP